MEGVYLVGFGHHRGLHFAFRHAGCAGVWSWGRVSRGGAGAWEARGSVAGGSFKNAQRRSGAVGRRGSTAEQLYVSIPDKGHGVCDEIAAGPEIELAVGSENSCLTGGSARLLDCWGSHTIE